ncbi:MAG: hypothetical protein FJZ01_26565 [Candidatus Sericytochromatia bacterium]|nr:hypothetical protein [Candidatus Tanganyikabacteria bacterium]
MSEPEYRVVRRATPAGDAYVICWAKVSEDGTFRIFGGPEAVEAESAEGLREVLAELGTSLDKPVLDFSALREKSKKEPSSVRAMERDTSVIPTGDYCYELTSRGKLVCPYWQPYFYLPPHANGYCWFMGKGDLEMQAEGRYSLLWDEIKECGVNPRVPDPAADSAARWVADTLHAYIETHPDVDRIFVDFEIDPSTKRKVVVVTGVNGIEDPDDKRVRAHFRALADLLARSDDQYQAVEPDTALSVSRDRLPLGDDAGD